MKKMSLLLMAVAFIPALSSCGHKDEVSVVGDWTSAAPVTVTKAVDGATSATKVISIDFNAPIENAANKLTYTAKYDVTATVDDATQSYQVVATIDGTWTRDAKDDDEFLLTFDRNSLSVSGTDAPELGPVTDEFLSSIATFTKIEDVKVSKDGTHLTFETDHPDTEYHFVKK